MFSQGQILLTYRTGKNSSIPLESCCALCCFCFKQSIPEQTKSIASHPTFGDVIYSQQITYDVFCCKGLGWAKPGGIGRQPTKGFICGLILKIPTQSGSRIIRSSDHKTHKNQIHPENTCGFENESKPTKYSWGFVIFCGFFFVGCRP